METAIICGAGMISKSLIKVLLNKFWKIKVISNDIPNQILEMQELKKYIRHNEMELINTDLLFLQNCYDHIKEADIVFNLTGMKGSASSALEKSADFLYRNTVLSSNIIEAVKHNKIKNYVFTSSVAVYDTNKICDDKENIWDSLPSKNDIYGGWGKRTGELMAEAYSKQYGINCFIARPSNVYGFYDNFGEGSMFIPSLIKKAYDSVKAGTYEYSAHGDGEPIRSVTFSDDVARALLFIVENNIKQPVNISSGIYKISEIIDEINGYFGTDVWFDSNENKGDKNRIMDKSTLIKKGFNYNYPLSRGIRETCGWYRESFLKDERL